MAYTIVISEEQHWAKRPEKQPIVSIRSVNLWPLVGMTVSFLKSVVMHEAYPHLFLHRYTRERALFCTLHATCLHPVNLLPDFPGVSFMHLNWSNSKRGGDRLSSNDLDFFMLKPHRVRNIRPF